MVEAQTADGKYVNSSDYARDLIRRDVEKRAKVAAVNEKIEEAHESGLSK
ncbi:MAG: type II toxin-antitoxin system ParD family antitoxin [Hyphomonadaceae bacterium]|nr:type II toxin-antitoxin system ParD family antitoxin [Hyphomonadaceae bacterium]